MARTLVDGREALKLWNEGNTALEVSRQLNISTTEVKSAMKSADWVGVKLVSAEEWNEKRVAKRARFIEEHKQRMLKEGAWEIPSYKGQNSRGFAINAKLATIGLKKKCELCGLKKYPGILHTHHRDNNKKNNDTNNLLILCPNCHALIHLWQKERKKP